MKLHAYTDGAARGNPGESASGYRILDSSRRLLCEAAFYNGKCTNNAAEYAGIIAAMKKALQLGCDDLVLSSDSRLVINQIAGSYKVKSSNLKAFNREAKALLGRFKKHELLNVPRENKEVKLVDGKLNEFLDEKQGT